MGWETWCSFSLKTIWGGLKVLRALNSWLARLAILKNSSKPVCSVTEWTGRRDQSRSLFVRTTWRPFFIDITDYKTNWSFRKFWSHMFNKRASKTMLSAHVAQRPEIATLQRTNLKCPHVWQTDQDVFLGKDPDIW